MLKGNRIAHPLCVGFRNVGEFSCEKKSANESANSSLMPVGTQDRVTNNKNKQPKTRRHDCCRSASLFVILIS